MCGIAGFFDPTRARSLEAMQATVDSMAAALSHRGPDDSGTWLDHPAGIALGHRRLSVVDLSPLGHQPMASADGRFIIVYNGEIYNFRELREELRQRGHEFRSRSDTEVMLVAFQAWGVAAAVPRFNGMFAFAVWDRQLGQLHLARDRFGEKPLYYGWLGRDLVFASELKAIRSHPAFKADIDRDAIALYMRHGYVPAPYSIFSDVRKLPSGTILTVGPDGGTPSPTTYWSVAEAALRASRSPFSGSDGDAVAAFEELLADAVRIRLEADVPLGAFLSGGMDSSTIVALMQRQRSDPVRTFTVGFHEAAYNEAEDARRVAAHLGTDHTELYTAPEEALAVIPRLPRLYDEPFGDSSAIPTFLISSLARRHVTVCLSGDGGDELLAGYTRYAFGLSSWRWMRRVPRILRRTVGSALTALSPDAWDRLFAAAGSVLPRRVRHRHVGNKVHRLAGILAGDTSYPSLMSHWQQPASVVLGATARGAATASLPAELAGLHEVQQMTLLDALTYLPDDILVKVDRASMGVSLETRVPFLDHRVAEFCWSLPVSQKVRGGQQKWLLRQLLRKYVPADLVERPKSGFVVPIAAWLRGRLRDWAEALLAEPRLRNEGLLDPRPVRQAWAEHVSMGRDRQHQLWLVLMLQAWLDEWRQ